MAGCDVAVKKSWRVVLRTHDADDSCEAAEDAFARVSHVGVADTLLSSTTTLR